MIRYFPRSDNDYFEVTTGVFAFYDEDFADIDKQARDYMFKRPPQEQYDRVQGHMTGWFFEIPNYPVREGFGDITYYRSTRQHAHWQDDGY